ncbi:MAG: 50S ribosomal protein L29 [Candidatus Moraniibacteriota bacterium]
MKFQAWKEKTKEEREKALTEMADKARKLRFDLATRQAKGHRQYRTLRKDIARLKTLGQRPRA